MVELQPFIGLLLCLIYQWHGISSLVLKTASTKVQKSSCSPTPEETNLFS